MEAKTVTLTKQEWKIVAAALDDHLEAVLNTGVEDENDQQYQDLVVLVHDRVNAQLENTTP